MRRLRNFTASHGGENGSGDECRRMADEAMKKYGSMDEDALIARLTENVKRQKQEGTFDPESIGRFVEFMSPHLTAEQKQRLDMLVKVINSDD